MRCNLWWTAVLLVLTAPAPSNALLAQEEPAARTVPPEKAKAIRTLLELGNSAELFLLGFEEAASAQPEPPELPPGFWDALRKKARAEVPQFIEMLVPVYDAQFTLEEVNGLIMFYRTPVGQRFIAAQPELMKELMRLGERWGMMLAGQVMIELANQDR